jgi:hypothetical protein
MDRQPRPKLAPAGGTTDVDRPSRRPGTAEPQSAVACPGERRCVRPAGRRRPRFRGAARRGAGRRRRSNSARRSGRVEPARRPNPRLSRSGRFCRRERSTGRSKPAGEPAIGGAKGTRVGTAPGPATSRRSRGRNASPGRIRSGRHGRGSRRRGPDRAGPMRSARSIPWAIDRERSRRRGGGPEHRTNRAPANLPERT